MNCYISGTPSAGAQSARYPEDNVLSHHADAATLMAAQSAPMTVLADAQISEQLYERILSSLNEDKAEDVISIDLRGRSEMADHMVICSGRSSRQVSAISEKLVDTIKQEFGVFCKLEGKNAGDWVLIDAGDVIVHVFRPEVREFYQLEKMWLPTGAAGPSTSTSGGACTSLPWADFVRVLKRIWSMIT